MPDRRKILCKARRRKEREFIAKIYDEISPPKARLRPSKTRQKIAKRLKSRRRKIFMPKLRLQIPLGKIALGYGAGFELAANFLG